EGLVVRLEVQRAVFARVDHASLLVRRPPAIRKCRVPATAIPGPANALVRQRIADRLLRLHGQRKTYAFGTLWVRHIKRTVRRRRDAARLERRLRRVDGITVGCHLPANSTDIGLDGTVLCRG